MKARDRTQLLQRTDSTGRHYRFLGRLEKPPDPVEVRPPHRSVAADVGVNEVRDAGGLELLDGVDEGDPRPHRPAVGRELVPLHVQGDHDALAVAFARLAQGVWVLQGCRRHDGPSGPGGDDLLDVIEGPQTASGLNGARGPGDDLEYQLSVEPLAGFGTVQIDDVQPARAGATKTERDANGIVRVHALGAEASLQESYATT